MKSILIIISILILPITTYATEVTDVEVCKRVEGCKLIFSSETMETYCPTCVKESIIISLLAKPRTVSVKDDSILMWLRKYSLKYYF
jgi:hypothetical protein